MLMALQKEKKKEIKKWRYSKASNFNYIVKETSWFVVICTNNISIEALLWVRVFHDCQKKPKNIQIKTNLCTYVFVLYFCIEIIALKLKKLGIFGTIIIDQC